MSQRSAPSQGHPCWAEIDLRAVRQNFRALQKLSQQQFIPSAKKEARSAVSRGAPLLSPVIKSEAYGHGMLEVARTLAKSPIGYLCVSDTTEGIELRKAGIRRPILLFESTLLEDARQIVAHRLTPTVCTLAMAAELNRIAAQQRRKADIHIKVDTGMGRLGVPQDKAMAFIRRVMTMKNLSIRGIYTHFPLADCDPSFTRSQMEYLTTLISSLDKHTTVPFVHAANSMGLAGYKTDVLNLARPGIMLYGLYPYPKLRTLISLKPAMSVKARILFVKFIPKGTGISYGHTYKARRLMKVATIPIGYSDGYHRRLSNKASILVNGRRCPVVGNVTMDQIMVDVSKVKNVRPGQTVTILGRERNEEISADELARHIGTIHYEVVCSLGRQLPRVYRP